MQKKDELLSQLDNALKRKVQQKFMKQSKAPDTLTQQFYGQPDKSKYNTKQQQKYTTISSHVSKSPVVSHHKQPIIKSQNNINLKTSHSPIQSPKLQTQRDIKYDEQASSLKMATSIQENNVQAKMKQEIKRLRSKNTVLEKELNQFKYNIAQLQGQSKRLRRDQNQYTKLKQQNANLVRQIQFMRSKSNEHRSKSNLEQEIKPLMMQLNINFLNKHSLQQCLKSVSQAVNKLIEQKSKLVGKLNNFDIESLLIKENNQSFKRELQLLRKENEQLQNLIQQDCVKIQQFQQTIQAQRLEKKSLEVRCKQANKELEGLKKQFKLMVQGSKHSKPKRQQSAVRHNKQNIIQNSAVKIYNDQESQVESDSNPSQMRRQQENTRFLQRVNQLNCYIKQLQEELTKMSRNKQNEAQMAYQLKQIEQYQQIILNSKMENNKQKQSIYKCEEYIKQLQYKCEMIQKDINHFMPKLKAMEEENQRLKNEQLYKDQEIIQKMTTINQMRNHLEQVEEKVSIAQLQLNKQVFELKLAKTQIQRLQNQICYFRKRQNELMAQLNRRANEFTHQLQISNVEKSQRERQLITKVSEYERIAFQKANQIDKLNHQWSIKQKQFLLSISKMQSIKQMNVALAENLKIQQKRLAETQQTLKLQIAESRQNDQRSNQLIVEYDCKFKELKQSTKRFQSHSNHLIQEFGKHEQLYNSIRQEKNRLQSNNQSLTLKNDELTRQIFAYKCDVQRLSFDSKNNCQLKQYFQQVADDLKAKLEQLISQLTKTQGDKTQLIEKLTHLQNAKHQIEVRQAERQYNWVNKNQQCEQLKNELYRLSQQFNLLSHQYVVSRQQSQRLQRERCQQISLQNYDMQRLIRESKELKTRIEQLTSLRQSSHFRESSNDQRIAVLTEQNRSLLRKNELLLEQVQMKLANKQEDLYLSQLKNKQYCILLKKILCDIISEQELDSCNSFQLLLQMGSQRVVKRKKQIRDKQSELRKQTVQNQYQLQEYVSQPIRRIYIGTQISSSEEIMCRNFGPDQVLQMESNIKEGSQKEFNDTPKSFRFSMSPYEQRRQKRTQRLISCFNSKIEGKSNLTENK